MAVRGRRLLRDLNDVGHHGPDIGRCEVDLEIAGVEPRDVEELVDDRGQTVRLGGNEAEERSALPLPEEHVLAEQRLGEAVDRGQRRSQLVGNRRDEVGLHLLDDPFGRDVPEREDPPGDSTGRVTHDRFGQGEPDIVVAAADRQEPVSALGVVAGRERLLEDLLGRAADRIRGPDAGNPLRSLVPEQDPALAIDGNDPVGDVREDGDAALLFERDALVQLRARKGGGGVAGKRRERLDLLGLPSARVLRIDRQDALHASLGADERHGKEGAVSGGERRVRGAGPLAFDVPDRDRCARLDRVRGCPAGGGGTRVEQVVG